MHVWYLSFIASLDLRGCAHTALVCTVCIVTVTARGGLINSKCNKLYQKRSCSFSLDTLLLCLFGQCICGLFSFITELFGPQNV